MPSLVPGFEYDIFISYRHKDNMYDGWVSHFVADLKRELEATLKETVSVYFDESPHDGLLELHHVAKSLEGKLKCLIFLPIISQTYCDPKCFAWQSEFLVFNTMTKNDSLGMEISVGKGNVMSRILAVKINEIDSRDKKLIEDELGGPIRAIDFIYKTWGVNRPLRINEERPQENIHGTLYRNQINKVANAVKDLIAGIQHQLDGNSTDELTVPEFHQHQHIPMPEKGRLKKYRALWILGIIVFVITAAYIGFTKRKILLDTDTEKSIAVLPFKNISADNKDQYFSDGMTEEIINYLAKAGELKVISRTSTDRYRDVNNKDIRTIANELNVSHVLEGSVRKSGNTFRISVKLIQGETGYPLWSDDYDREITDVLQVQSDISKEVTDILKVVLTESERENMEHVQAVALSAYDFYLQARSEMVNYRIAGDSKGHGHLGRAIDLFRSSIDVDPKFARSYSGLGLACLLRYMSQVMYLTPSSLDSVKNLADQALQLDKRVDEAYFLLGMYYWQKGEIDNSIAEYKHALQLNPNYVDAMLELGQIYCGSKVDFVNGLSQLERAIRLGRGPELANNLRSVGGAYFAIGMFDKNLELYRSAMRLDHDSSHYYWLRSHIERVNHRYETGLAFANEACRLDPNHWGYVDQKGWMLEMLGRNQEALALRLKWFDQTQRTTMPLRVAHLYWVLGQKEKALQTFNHMRSFAEASIAVNAPYASGKMVYYDLAGISALLGEKEKAYNYLSEVSTMSFFPAWFASLIEIDPLFNNIRGEAKFKAIQAHIKQSSEAERIRVEAWLQREEMNTTIQRN